MKNNQTTTKPKSEPMTPEKLTFTDEQLGHFMDWMKLQDHWADMDNRELLWHLKNYVNSLNLDQLGTADSMFSEIENRLYPEYDGENVHWTETGWVTPDGEVNYSQPHTQPEHEQTPSSRFFIVNVYDRPSAEHIAERRADGKFYYVHPALRNEKQYRGMTPEKPTPLEDFGIRFLIEGGRFHGKRIDPSRATYNDGRLRNWQGDAEFSFSIQA